MDTSAIRQSGDIDASNRNSISTKEMVEKASIQERLDSITDAEELRHLIYQTTEQLSVLVNKASLADMAGGVFHNLGNVLNSLNISVLMIEGNQSSARLEGLKKLTELIEQSADSTEFFKDHPKGKHIPNYLRKLTDVLIEEAEQVTNDILEIKQHVGHMKELIRVQQDLLKTRKSAMTDAVDLEHIINEAVQITRISITRHRIDLKTHCEPLIEIQSDRHKILQILVNFITNAKQACESYDKSELKIFMRGWAVDDTKVCIEVEDTGIGISEDAFSQLFSHGFTTKLDGHGFGLHSCKRLATELGGYIEVDSAGVGRGARFRLFLASDLNQVS
ncbi:MAG: sensor histidine kinase [Opitutales bacterium]